MLRKEYLDDEFVGEMRKRYFREDKLFSLSIKKPVILAIDMQNYFLSPSGKAYLPSAESFLKRIKNFFNAVKDKVSIIFTQHCHEGNSLSRWWGDDMRCEGHGFEIHPELRDFAIEIVRKHTYSAFHETSLHTMLRERGADTLIITGVMTHLCCETTARDAVNHGYNVIFPIDGSVTQNREVHECSLKALSHGFAVTPTLRDVIEWMHLLE